MNPLLQDFNTPFNTAPFSKIKESHFKSAFSEAIALAQEEIDAIVKNTAKPTFKNTIEALEFSGQKLDRISSIFFNLNSAETNDKIQALAQEISPLLTKFSNDIRLNSELFDRITHVYSQRKSLELNAEEKMLLSKNYKAFIRNGANLNSEEKNTLRKIDAQLAQLKLKFGENVLAESNAFLLHITERSELSGLPKSILDAAKQAAEQHQKKGWVFTLDYPSYVPFMKYAKNRVLRKKMALAFGSRGFNDNSFNNEQLVLKLVKLRHQRAVLLGYNSHAHYVLEERMAQSPEKVTTFLNELLSKSKPAALDEFEQLNKLAIKDGIMKMQPWDAAYYSEKLKKSVLDLDEEAIRPYFKLENVIQGVFTISRKLFGLNFEETTAIDVYHKDVRSYKVLDELGNFIAILYADFFPRKGKRNGAWMTSFKGQWKNHKENSRPHISIVCNFTKPSKETPSLLTFNEVTTLFHEFGHALHGMLADTTYKSLSGTNVYWDFVELPSQLFENWCYEEEALKLFAKHYKTEAPIPMEYIEKIKKASNFLEGLQTVRQLSFGFLDMAWHGKNPTTIKSVKEHEKKAFNQTTIYPDVPTSCMSTAFSHIFQGGYSSGYYSYKWAEVLDADAFALFKKKGIFNRDVSEKFKTYILTKGGTEKPMDLYVKFRGSKPSSEYLLKRAGLLK